MLVLSNSSKASSPMASLTSYPNTRSADALTKMNRPSAPMHRDDVELLLAQGVESRLAGGTHAIGDWRGPVPAHWVRGGAGVERGVAGADASGLKSESPVSGRFSNLVMLPSRAGRPATGAGRRATAPEHGG